jgi:hypothetical protein
VKKEKYFFFANGARGSGRAAGIGPRKQIDKSLFASFSSEKEESSFLLLSARSARP